MAENDRQELIYGDGPLDKANLVFLDSKGKDTLTLPVQFNPSSYAISRTMNYHQTNGIGQEIHPSDMQPVKGTLAKLSATIYIDSSSTPKNFVVPKRLEKYLGGKDEIAQVCTLISMMTKYNYETHLPKSVLFSWGSLQFLGNATEVNVVYEMFNREGKPVRAKIDLTIEGEEKGILKEIKANPNESPDRTKYRALGQVDELWMLAYDEYDDAGAWREIAKENDILNPRKVDYTKKLKVPSL